MALVITHHALLTVAMGILTVCWISEGDEGWAAFAFTGIVLGIVGTILWLTEGI